MSLPLYASWTFSLIAFGILSLFYIVFLCLDYYVKWRASFLALCIWCLVCFKHLEKNLVLKIRDFFSMTLLNM